MYSLKTTEVLNMYRINTRKITNSLNEREYGIRLGSIGIRGRSREMGYQMARVAYLKKQQLKECTKERRSARILENHNRVEISKCIGVIKASKHML